MTNPLTQIIVSTKGQGTIVTQGRNALGQFTSPSKVERLTDIGGRFDSIGGASPDVVVMHAMNGQEQVVAAVNRTSGRSNVSSFINDGTSGGSLLTLMK